MGAVGATGATGATGAQGTFNPNQSITTLTVTDSLNLPTAVAPSFIPRMYAVGEDTNDQRTIQYSTDGGTTFIAIASGGFATRCYGITYSASLGRYVAVGTGTGSTNNIQWSDDGINFSNVTSNTGLQTEGRCVCWDGLYFWAGGVGNGVDGFTNLVRSTDGLTWTTPHASTQLPAIAINAIVSNQYPRVIIVGGESATGTECLKYSTNLGSTWASASAVFNTGAGAGCKAVAYQGSGRWVAGGQAGANLTFKFTTASNILTSWGASQSLFYTGICWNGVRGIMTNTSATAAQRIQIVSTIGNATISSATNASTTFGNMYGVDSAYGYTLAVGEIGGGGVATDQYRIATGGSTTFGKATTVPGFSVRALGAYIVRDSSSLLTVGNMTFNSQNYTFDNAQTTANINTYLPNQVSIGDVMFINTGQGTNFNNQLISFFKPPDNANFPFDCNAIARFVSDLTVSGTLSASGTNGVAATVVRIGNPASPTFNLQLAADSAGKPTTNTWNIVSDYRIKKNIVLADLNRCYEIIKNLPLKYYEWNYPIESNIESKDKHSLGFIAQDVEQVFPNAVETFEEVWGIPNLKTLNNDQIIKVSHGAIQKLMEKIEILEARVAELESKL